jgi:DNA-directed RNA polymerase specialized sigma subunit
MIQRYNKIIAWAHDKGLGNKKLDDLRSAADVAIGDAYQNFASDKGAKMDTYASTAVCCI